MKMEQSNREFYTKVTNKGITLRSQSHHPLSVNVAGMRNEFNRAEMSSTSEFQKYASTISTENFKRNGLSTSFIQKVTTLNNCNGREQKIGKNSALVLRVQFISERVSGLILLTLRQSNIITRLVNSRPATVFENSSSKRKPKPMCTVCQCPLPNIECTSRYVAYQAEFNICIQTY